VDEVFVRHPDRKEEEHALIRQIEKDYPPGEACVLAWSERTGKAARI
jgi:hypothetical protein